MTRTVTHRRRDQARVMTLIGTLTVLVIAIFAYVSYTANRGLPFQPRYHIYVDVPNADRVIGTSDVRIAGNRVGQVQSITAISATATRRPYARLELALDPSLKPLPADTGVEVRLASVLGATYVDLTPGQSARTIPEGGTLALSAARSDVELTDLLSVFGRASARNLQSTLGELAVGFAGRGPALNATLGSTAQLLKPLTDVARVLASPDARLMSFLHGYEATIAGLAPVRVPLADLVSGAATTFGALDRAQPALTASIQAALATESATTTAFTRIQPALDGLAQATVDLRAAARLLPSALPQIASTLDAGVPPLRQLPPLAIDLSNALDALRTLSANPVTSGSVRKLTDVANTTETTLQVLGPAQEQCNAFSLWAQDLSSVFGDLGVGKGPAVGNLVVDILGAFLEPVQDKAPSPDIAINYIPHETQSECESGNEPYTGQQQLTNPPGLQSNQTAASSPPPGALQLAQSAGLVGGNP
jgi:ABC-type transporter Mla subunit MlaD